MMQFLVTTDPKHKKGPKVGSTRKCSCCVTNDGLTSLSVGGAGRLGREGCEYFDDNGVMRQCNKCPRGEYRGGHI